MPRSIHTKMFITDVKVSVSHVNEKGIKVEGRVIIGVKITYGKYVWQKAYGFLEKDLKNFSLDEFKNKIYRESRVWIREKELQNQVLVALKDVINEEIKLD